MPVIDTSFLIRVHAGDPAARELFEDLRTETLVVPPWVVVEFLTGYTGNPVKVLPELARAFTLVQTTPEWTIEASRLRRELHRKGANVRLPDFWIAAFARLLDTYVVTRNQRHFAALGVETRTL